MYSGNSTLGFFCIFWAKRRIERIFFAQSILPKLCDCWTMLFASCIIIIEKIKQISLGGSASACLYIWHLQMLFWTTDISFNFSLGLGKHKKCIFPCRKMILKFEGLNSAILSSLRHGINNNRDENRSMWPENASLCFIITSLQMKSTVILIGLVTSVCVKQLKFKSVK